MFKRFWSKLQGKRKAPGPRVGEAVAEILRALPDNTIIRNGYPCPLGRIGHVVVSKHHGIFLVEVARIRGEVTVVQGDILVNNEPLAEDLVEQTLKKSLWLKDELKQRTGVEAWINPLIVFLHAYVRSSLPIQGVRVVSLKYLKETIMKHRATEDSMAVWLALENAQL